MWQGFFGLLLVHQRTCESDLGLLKAGVYCHGFRKVRARLLNLAALAIDFAQFILRAGIMRVQVQSLLKFLTRLVSGCVAVLGARQECTPQAEVRTRDAGVSIDYLSV